MSKNQKYFLISVFLIILVGIIMVYSSSYIYAKEAMGSSTHFLFKQLMFIIIGFSAAFIISRSKFNFWYKNIYWINCFFAFLLLLTFTPVGMEIKGSSRWISLGGFSLQPGEFIKYTVLLTAIKFFMEATNYDRNELIKYGLNILCVPVMLILQPDFGTFSIIISLLIFTSFLCNIPKKYLIGTIATGLIAVSTLVFAAPYRVKRLLTFLDPWSDPQNTGFQIIQSYLAFANGHIIGAGIGNSHEKLFYLPEAYNDFIFSVMGEELGFVGVVVVILFFVSFIFWGLKMAMEMNDDKNEIAAIFITSVIFCIGLQAFLNMGVVLGLLPTKGLNLPLISYGGSSIIANIVALGFVFSAYKFTPKNESFDQTSDFTFRHHEYKMSDNLYNRL